MDTQQRYEKILFLEEIKLEEAQALFTSQDVEDLKIANNKITESIARLESCKDKTTSDLIDSDVSLEEVKNWSETQRRRINNFRAERERCKELVKELAEREHEQRVNAEIEDQRRLIQEQTRLKLEQQHELEKMEEDWLQRKAALKSDLSYAENRDQTSETSQKIQPSVKLQKYTITPFSGDYKDWLRFWNQFTVEVDGSTISEISKFNYLLELVKGKPRDDVLGLPHTVDGYEEAKRILVQNYGRDSKVHKALIKELESIQPVTSIHKLEQVHDFYNKLSRIVRTLTTMKKLETAQSTVYTLMDKLGPVREVIVQKDDDWEEWGLEELVEHLRRYIERNPLQTDATTHIVTKEEKPARYGRRDQDKLLFNVKQGKSICIYCDSTEHSSAKCTRVLDVVSRREVLKRKRACFNCATPGHQASSCRARGCHRCGQKHHTTICTLPQQSSTSAMGNSLLEKGMSSTHHASGAIHPTLHASVNGEKVRIMIDTGASSSYICSDMISLLGLKPVRREKRCIEQMYGSMSKTVEVYKIQLRSIVNEETLDIECINAEKDVLTFLPKPCIDQIKKNNHRLRRLVFCEETIQSDLLPVHIMLGVTDYQRIRTGEPPVIGTNPDRDPGAEFTKFGWALFGVNPLGKVGEDTAKQFFLRNGQEEFEKLCSLDVLGVTDPVDSTQFVHSDYKAQISRHDEGYYEARLPWKTSQAVLPENKETIKPTKVMTCMENSVTDQMLQKYTLTKLLRVTAFMRRFCANAKGAGYKGPLTTEEIQNAEILWVRKMQIDLKEDGSLPLQLDNTGIWRVNSRIQGYKPIYIPRGTGLYILLVRHFHQLIGHGGASLTMGKVRERFWIPKLRMIVKSVIHKCYKCKKHRAKRLAARPTAALPEFRTTLTEPFAVTGVDFAGPLLYRSEQKTTEKAYIILYTCASTRAVHLKIVKGMGVADFQRSFKEFTARRGLPDKIISDNAKTFKAAKDWLLKLKIDADLHNYLAKHQIRWQFNLSRAPWWGGFFERLIGIMKSCLSKMIGNAMLKFEELEEVLLDTECIMNNRPLCYLGEDHDFPVITPNLLMRGQTTAVLDQDVDLLDDKSAVTKRMRYIQTCKEHTRKRWLREYIYALEERQRHNKTSEGQLPTKGSVVLITDNSKLKSVWKMGRIEDEIKGKDGTVRGYKIKTGNGYIVERPLQLICDLEIGGKTSSQGNEKVGDNNHTDSRETTTNERRRVGAPRLSKISARNRIARIYREEQENEDDD